MTTADSATGVVFLDKSVGDVLEGYRAGSLTATDLARECVNRVEALDGYYHAWATFDGERLLRDAQQTDDRLRDGAPVRRLEGIPVGVKDIFNTSDFPTQMGSPIWRGFT